MKHNNLFAYYSFFKRHKWMAGVVMFALFLVLGLLALPTRTTAVDAGPDDTIDRHAQQMLTSGRQFSATTRLEMKPSGATRSSCTTRWRNSRLTTRWH